MCSVLVSASPALLCLAGLLQFLHHNRIIHRDLKPGNVLVTKNCQLRITDFGLARLRPMGTGAGPDDEVFVAWLASFLPT